MLADQFGREVSLDVTNPFYELEMAARLGQTAGADRCLAAFPKCNRNYMDILNDTIQPLFK
jgi:hypothetical protein